MFLYSVTKHTLWDDNGNLLTSSCSSGYDEAANCSRLDDMTDIGPIPCSSWAIFQSFGEDFDMPLLPLDHGANRRVGFSLHGNCRKKSKRAGIYLPLEIRRRISESGDTLLLVVE